MRYVVIILVVSFILAVYKVIMELIKKNDRNNGLKIDDKNYSLLGTLLSPINQDKRIRKQNRKTFKDYKVDEKTWKSSYCLFVISAIVSIGFGIGIHDEIVSIILMGIMASILYFTRRMQYLAFLDIIVLCSIIYSSVKYNIPILIIIPSIILINFVSIREYLAYRRSLKENEKS